MEYLLILLLFLLLFLVYRMDGNRIVTPASLSVLVFLISSIVFLLNAKKWETQIGITSIFLIISALLVFWLGTRTRVRFVLNSRDLGFEARTENYIYKIKPPIIIAFFLLGILVDFLIYRRSMQILSKYSASQYLLGTLRTALSNDESWGTGISIIREGFYAVGYSCLFAYCVNVCNTPKSNWYKWLYLLLPVIPMLIAMFLSTGRTGFIRVLCVAFITCVTVINYKNKIRFGKFARYGIIVFVVLLLAFFELGKATGKSQIFSPFDTLSIYIGSSIGAFDAYLKNPSSYSNSFAGETLYGIRSIFRMFNEKIVSTPIALPFHMVAHGYNTNVYTALRRYINDFGIIGMYVIMFFEGIIFGNWERLLKEKKSKGLSLLLYAYFMYDIIMMSIEENFLREFLTLAQIFILIVFYIVYKFILSPSRLVVIEEN